MMRVAYIDHTARWSGGEVALYNILTNIGEHIDPLVILAEEGDLADRLRQRDIDVRIVPLDDSIRNRGRNAVNLGAPAAAFRLLAYGRKLAPLLREEKVVCVHTNSLKSALYGAVAAKSAKLPLIWHIRDHIGPPYLKPIVAKGIRLMSRFLPNGVIANSKSTLSALELPRTKRRSSSTPLLPKQLRLVIRLRICVAMTRLTSYWSADWRNGRDNIFYWKRHVLFYQISV